MTAIAPIAIAMQAGSQIYGGIQQSKALKGEARALEENARRTEGDAARSGIEAYRASRMAMGEDMAAAGASGGVYGGSSAADVIAASAIEREMEVMNIHYQANSEAMALRKDAKQRRKAAKGAIIGSILGAAANALSSASGLRQQSQASNQNQQIRSSQAGGYGMPIPSGGR